MSQLENNIKQEIEDVRRGKKKELDLSYWRLIEPLEHIPDEVFELSQLEMLSLYGNNIRVIPDRIRELPNLRVLQLQQNPIEKLPDMPGLYLDWDAYLRCSKELSRQCIQGININTKKALAKPSQALRAMASMPNLRSLSLGLGEILDDTKIHKPTGSIKKIIGALGELERLVYLRIHGVLLEDVPPDVRELKKLRTLALSGAGIQTVPDWLFELRNLEILDFRTNNLESLPDSLADLPYLEKLLLTDNRFTEFPQVLFRMKSLAALSLSSSSWRGYEGKIKHIPASILMLTNLHILDVENQPIENPPYEVVVQGLAAIRRYWRQQQEAGVDYLCEAKLIIVGEAGAGKTSLANKLRDRNYRLKADQRSTEGVEVIRWAFPTMVRVSQKNNGEEELLQRTFKVNIWDFGGQEVYHATHQFFLTRRSLYVLVSDNRKEDTDFYYWLQVVELLSDGSPVLVIQNEKQDRQRDIDLGGLRARFPSLRDTYRTNLATNRGLDDIIKAIQHELEGLPHIGSPLPRTWSRVREALEKDARNYIDLEEFLELCQTHGFVRREDKLQLSGYLHDLGICLHFQDDPVLKKTVILKPNWGTDAVYRVLDDPIVIERRGRFSFQELTRIWAEEKYAQMQDELLSLMMKFQLCYKLPEGKEYIAPQLLSSTRPAYNWDDNDNLVVRYEYDFMPKGVITRFTVAINHLIADQSLVWKSGVVIEREGTRGEIIEDRPRRKIVVRISGPDKRGLVAIVDDHLDRIHRSFLHLKYEKFLPCNCGVCGVRGEPFAYPLSELKDFARGGDKIQCRMSRKLIDAASLIREVFPAVARFPEALAEQTELGGNPLDGASGKEVYVSYAWSAESNEMVDQMEKAFEDRGIGLVRDKNEIRYRDSIRDFMRRIGQGKCIVVVLSRRYLESKNCMFELTEIADRGDIRDRVFPIVLPDANIYDASGRLDYIAYWEKKTKELNAKMKKVHGAHLHGVREELDLYDKIRDMLASIVNTLGDMNALTIKQHQGADFEELLRTLEERLLRSI